MRARRIDPEAFRPALERLYASYNNVVYANRDPVSVLHRFPRCADREIVGLLAAGLAYGRVASILKSVETALRPLGDEPARFVDSSSPVSLRRAFRGFRHRWTCAEDVVALLSGVKAMRAEWGSLGRGFRGVLREEEETVLPAAARWVRALKGAVDIEQTVDWDKVAAAVGMLTPLNKAERLRVSPEGILEAANHLAGHYRKADKPLPDILAALV